MKRILYVCLGLVVWLPAVASAQESAEPQDPLLMHRSPVKPEGQSTVPLQAGREGRIHLDVLVTDAAGKPVSGLAPQDFTLLADNQPQKIVSFRAFDGATAKPDPAVQVIVVVDAVNCGFSELGFIREGLEHYLRQNGGHLAQPVSLLMLTVSGLQKLSPPSLDGIALAAIVEQIRPSIRPQGVYTFPISVLTLSHIAQDQGKIPGRKLLVWLGPGWATPVPNPTVMTRQEERDRQSHFNLAVLLSTELREARIALYGGYSNSAFYERDFLKGVRKVTDEDPRNLSLGVLALESGGRGGLAYVNRDSDVFDQIDSFAAEASTFYTLSFDPPRTDRADEYHDLKVVVDKPDLIARTNTGYYNESELRQPEETPLEAILRQSEAHSIPPRTPVKRVAEFAGKPVTVAELEQTLKEVRSRTDGEAAKEISQLALTERLSSAKLAAWLGTFNGEKARSALTEVADASLYLNLPDADIPAGAAPDHDEQRRIISLALDYLSQTIPKLPNFYATRTTIRYEDTKDDPKHPGSAILTGEPLHRAGSSSVVVLYRNGRETVTPVKGKGRPKYVQEKGLVTRGTFGPILSTVMVDASHGETTFSHWEQGANSKEAVFSFVVPKEVSHYHVALRNPSVPSPDYDHPEVSGYHGEVAIDPATGAILRIALQAELDLASPMTRADIMVEYGPVDIGGKTYTCPVRSVSLSQAHAMILMRDIFENGTALGPQMTRLNDVVFADYHLFRGDVRIVSGDSPAPEEK